MPGQVIFYQLSRKFVEPGQNVPPNSKQLMHYTLALGHHIGVIDCFAAKLEIPFEGYKLWLDHLPEGEGRRKLQGLLRFGEIEISAPYAPLLQQTLAASSNLSAQEAEWTARLNEMLESIIAEPAIYLMVRRRS